MLRTLAIACLVALLGGAAWAQEMSVEDRVKLAKERLDLDEEQVESLTEALTANSEGMAAAKATFDAKALELLGEEQSKALAEKLQPQRRQRGERPQGERPQGERPQGERPQPPQGGEQPPQGERRDPRQMTNEERLAMMLERFDGVVAEMGITGDTATGLHDAYAAWQTTNQTLRGELEADLGAIFDEDQLEAYRGLFRRGPRGDRQPRQEPPQNPGFY